MVDKHIALPKTLSDTGELEEWLAKFEICASANGWSDERKAAKILTFLEGEVLVAYIEMADQDKADYDRLVAALKREFRTTGAQFRLMNEFEHRRLLPGETPRVFLYNLKRLLETAMPELSGEAKEKFLFHKFIEGLPKDVSRLMRSSVTDINTTKEALAKANSLTVNFEGDLKEVASVQENEEKFGKILSEMNRRLESLESEQKVAIVQYQSAKSDGRPNSQSVQCYKCHRWGHIARNCRTLQCPSCGKYGHTKSQCWGNANRSVPQARGADRKQDTWPQH
jgi:hypothetical protein